MTATTNYKVAGTGDTVPTSINTAISGGSAGGDGGSTATQILEFPFSVGGTYLVATGPMTLYGVILDTAVAGSIVIDDSTEPTFGPVVLNQITASGSNINYTAGTAPTFQNIYSGIYMVVTGNNVGRVLYSVREP